MVVESGIGKGISSYICPNDHFGTFVLFRDLFLRRPKNFNRINILKVSILSFPTLWSILKVVIDNGCFFHNFSRNVALLIIKYAL